MPVNKLIISLLKDLSKVSQETSNKVVREKVSKLMCSVLEADGCAVYLHHSDKKGLTLSKEDSFLKGLKFADSWQHSEWTLLSSPQYIHEPEQAKAFTEDISCQHCLILPLQLEEQTLGIVLVGWSKSSPVDDLSPEDYQILQVITPRLSDIFYIYPLLSHLTQREKDLATLYHKAVKDFEDNKKQISLELHDEVGQVLTSILLQLKLLQNSNDLEYIKGRLGGLHHITLETLEEVRRISQNLRPHLLEKLGLKAAVEVHVNEYIQTTGIDVELRTHNLGERVSEALENIVYRAVQEGLTNVARHSGANKVVISLTIKGNNLFLQILDNGKGMEKNHKDGIGLLGIKERVSRAQGKFWLINKPGLGLTINVLLPLA